MHTFGPLQLSRVALHLEVLMALGAAELEHGGIIAHEGDAMPWVDGAAAEPTFLQPHGGCG